jgi:prepilin-type processing-associated H-X9-DG protein
VASTPEATIAEFVRLFNAKDYPKAAMLVKGGKANADYTGIKQITGSFQVTLGAMTSETHGNRATVTVKSTASEGSRPPITSAEKVNLIKENDRWLIVPPAENGRTTGMIASIAGMTTAPTKIFATAPKAAKKTECLTNLRRITMAAMMSSADTNDVYKFNASNVRAVLQPYLKNDKVWYCPDAPKTVSYSFNARLAGKKLTQIKDPSKTVLFYEGANGKLAFRHGGVAAVAFADGHVKFFKPADAAKLNWKA